jgi:hypothetical protein
MKSVGDVVRTKRHSIDMVVIKVGKSPARGDVVYTLRFADQPNDERGFLVWAEDLIS